uniref:Heparanase n=1 Tax=Fundulus heteroclitus TaxID=8078 RepID=A0A3Q2T0U0_FUNHE
MDSVLLLLLALFSYRTGGNRLFRGSSPVGLDLDLEVDADLSAVFRRVDPRFLSVTIDASLASNEKFMLLLRSQRIRTLAKALSPAFLRFGGTKQDFMVFRPKRSQQLNADEPCSSTGLPWWLEQRLKEDWTQQKLILLKEEQQNQHNRVHFTGRPWMSARLSPSGAQSVFWLFSVSVRAHRGPAALVQQLLGPGSDLWPERAAQDHGQQLEQQQRPLSAPVLRVQTIQHVVGAGERFLQSGAEAVDACTWHHYYVNSRNTSLHDFLDPEVLDSLALKIQEVLKRVKQEAPGKPVWLGETSSAYGGGAAGLSDAFVSGFMWLDKLGLGAKLGLDVVMRQELFGSGHYQLIDDDLDPLPDYWLSLLYKRLVGPEVLKLWVVSDSGRSKRVRLYLHCANRRSYASGAVVLISMNLSRKPARISLPVLLSGSTVDAFVLQSSLPGKEGLQSRSVQLNGVLLKMVDDKTLPELSGARSPPAERVQLPAFSLGFFVFSEARAPACR